RPALLSGRAGGAHIVARSAHRLDARQNVRRVRPQYRCPDQPLAEEAGRRRLSGRRHQDRAQCRLYPCFACGRHAVTLPRRRWWRIFCWIAVVSILVEVLALTSPFIEAHRRRIGSAAGLVPDQIAAVVHLWPGLDEMQRRDMLRAISWPGLNVHVGTDGPPA